MNRRLAMASLLAFLLPLSASAQDAGVPEGYPDDYQSVIEAARSESGLLIYSNFPASFWKPVLDGFKSVHPGITVETVNMDAELWEKYYAESSTKSRTADLITTVAPERWVDFIERGEMVPYQSPEIPNLPDWSRPFEGLYTISTVPMLIAWNRALVQTPPSSLEDIVDMANAAPDEFKGRVTTFDAEANPYGLAIFRNWVLAKDNDWSLLEALAPYTRPERSSGTMREKLTTGEYLAGFFLSGAGIAAFEAPGTKQTAGYTFPKDGTPVSLQNIAITKGASSPNSARVFLDYMLSRDGQLAFAKGGFTPYREDIAESDVPFYTLDGIRKIVGAENVFVMTYDEEALAASEEIRQRWIKTFRK